MKHIHPIDVYRTFNVSSGNLGGHPRNNLAQPAVALLLVKAAACGLAVYAWRSRRTRLLRRANLFFALCVGWNLLAIAIA